MKPPLSPAVAAAFDGYPAPYRERLLALRELIFRTAAATEGVGEITETLKWGEPAYLTEESKSGTTIRLGWKAAAPDQCALYVHCQTTLIASFREWFPHLTYEGTRAIVFPGDAPIPTDAVACCIEAALTYRRRPDP